MKLKMSQNSLFAILLRSPWWVSALLVLVIALASRALLPANYVVFGVMGAFPFVVISGMAAWRQWRAPNPQHTADGLQRVGALSWSEFSGHLERAYTAQGYVVEGLHGVPADFQMTRNGRVTLLCCKRWKAASMGLDILRELVELKEKREAQQITCICLKGLTDPAQRYAAKQGIHVMADDEIARLLSY